MHSTDDSAFSLPDEIATETWLREQVVPAAQALKAAPERALSVHQVREHLATKRQRCSGTGKP